MLLGVSEHFSLQKTWKTKFPRIHKTSYPEVYKLFKGQEIESYFWLGRGAEDIKV